MRILGRTAMTLIAVAVCWLPILRSAPSRSIRVRLDVSPVFVSLGSTDSGLETTAASKPIVVEHPVLDVGRIRGGQRVEAYFPVENTTDQPMWIRMTQALVGTMPPHILCIEPLSSEFVHVTYTAGNTYIGPFSKTTYVDIIEPPANALEILAQNEARRN